MSNQSSAASQPSIDEVMNEVLNAISKACAPLNIEAEARNEFLDTYQPKFSTRLSNGSWHADRGNVLLAAQQHGIIAKALATLRHETSVDEKVLMEAGALVRVHCRAVFREGVWCS